MRWMWEVPGLCWALAATNRRMLNPRVVMLGAPTSLASTMALGPNHAPAATHAGRRSFEAGQREHVVWQGITAGSWSEFLCLGDYLAPPRQESSGASPAGCARPVHPRRSPLLAPRRRAGPWQGPSHLGIEPFGHISLCDPAVVFDNSKSFLLK
jgi:hypothetical protein